MKSETNKFKVKRELKFRIPEKSLKQITKACSGYGNGQIVAAASGLSYNTVADALKTKLATKKVLDSLLEGIEQIKQAA